MQGINLRQLYPAVKAARAILRAIDNPLRQEMLLYLRQYPGTTPREVQRKFRLVQAIASYQLGILHKAGIVIVSKNGRYRYYTVNEAYLLKIESLSRDLVKAA